MTTRMIIWWMLFAAIFFQSFQMIDINIAITKMVGNRKHSDIHGICGASKIHNSSQTKNTSYGDNVLVKQHNQFDWTEQQQNWVIGGLLWFQWAMQIPAGIMLQKFGAKIVIGLSIFVACLLSATIPTLAAIDSSWVIVVRALQGVIASIGLPVGIGTVVAQWAPPDERGKFCAVTIALQLGLSVGYPFFGIILTYLSWEYVFYSTAAFGTLWYIAWYFLVYDSPDQHPRISQREKLHIDKSLANVTTTEKLPIPWKNILTSVPLAVNIFCSFGQIWSTVALRTYLPMYLKTIHGMDSKMIGIVTGLLYLMRSSLQLSSGIITDSMVRRGIPKTKLRNIVVVFSAIIPGIIIFGMVFTKCDILSSIVVLAIFMFTSSANEAGAPVALLEMSPNFSGVTRGIAFTFIMQTGFFNSLLFNVLSSNFDTMTTWQYFFAANGFINLIPGVLFVLYSNSEVQPWNNPTERTDKLTKLINHSK